MGSLTSGVKADNFEDVQLGSLTSVAVTDQPSKTEDDSLLINGDDSIFKQSNKIMEESLDQIDGKIGEQDDEHELGKIPASEGQGHQDYANYMDCEIADVQLTDEVIDKYFKALTQVTQNRTELNNLESITEYSGESDITMAIDKMPANSKQELELKSMILQLDSQEIVDITKLDSSIDFSIKLQTLGLLTALPKRERSSTYAKSASFK